MSWYIRAGATATVYGYHDGSFDKASPSRAVQGGHLGPVVERLAALAVVHHVDATGDQAMRVLGHPLGQGPGVARASACPGAYHLRQTPW